MIKKIAIALLVFVLPFFAYAVDNQTYEKIQCIDMQVPYVAAEIVSTLIIILQIAVPIIIIFVGSIDFIKAVIAQKEDEIKKNQKTFVRRLIIGVFAFLVFLIVKVIIGFIAPQNENVDMWNCVDCFVNGKCTIINSND